jgi:hypothetical protein
MKWPLKRLPVAFLALSLPSISLAQTSAVAEAPALSQLVNNVLQQVQTLHPGMARSAVKAFFDQDGGLHAFGETRYDYRLCHSIKIDVKFKPATKTDDEAMREERDDDIIVEISKPYLQYPFYD